MLKIVESSKRPKSRFIPFRPIALLLALPLLEIPGWGQPTPPAVARIPVGSGALAIAVNPATNKVYVANRDDGTVTVIDDITYTVAATLSVGASPVAVEVNPTTDRIYVVNQGSDNVTVLDGVTYAMEAITVGAEPVAVAVNPLTNTVYIANRSDNTVTVIDGATNLTETVAVGLGPVAFAIDTAANKVYVANSGEATLTALDGSTNTTSTILINKPAVAVAVDPETHVIRVAMPNKDIGTCAIQKIDGTNPVPFNTICTHSSSLFGSGIAVKNNPVNHDFYALLNYTHPRGQDGALLLFPSGMTLTYLGPTLPDASNGLAIDELAELWYGIIGPNLFVMATGTAFPPIRGHWIGEYFAIAANPTTGGVFVSGHGPVPYGNNLMVMSFGSDLGISMLGTPNPVMTGSELTYTLAATNYGPRSATEVMITSILPFGTSAVSCTPSAGTCGGSPTVPSVSIDVLEVGSSISVVIEAAVPCGVEGQTTLAGAASVVARQGDPIPGNNSVSGETTALDPRPMITGALATPPALWPPDNRMVDVAVEYEVSDNCPVPPNSCALSVSSNGPPSGGDPDWFVVDAHLVRLRAARRSKGGLERVYTVEITCNDSGGGSVRESVQVGVSRP